jgi:hypothetical protein
VTSLRYGISFFPGISGLEGKGAFLARFKRLISKGGMIGAGNSDGWRFCSADGWDSPAGIGPQGWKGPGRHDKHDDIPMKVGALMAVIPLLAGAGMVLFGVAILGLQALNWFHRGVWNDTTIGVELAPLGVTIANFQDPTSQKVAQWIFAQPLGIALMVVGIAVFILSGFLLAKHARNASLDVDIRKRIRLD